MDTLGKRLRHIRTDVLELNQAQMAEKIGFSRTATISDYEKGKRVPDIETLKVIAERGRVNIGWLLTGDGPMSVYENRDESFASDGGDDVYTDEYVKVNVFAAGGETDSLKDFPSSPPVDAVYVPKKDAGESVVAVRIEGDSMSPTVLDGATVGIDTTDRQIVSGRLYGVFLSYEGVAVKRVFVHPDRVDLRTDNPAFPQTEIPTGAGGDDFILGSVKWVYQRY